MERQLKAIFIIFFPTITSGPIDRYQRFKKDLDAKIELLNGYQRYSQVSIKVHNIHPQNLKLKTELTITKKIEKSMKTNYYKGGREWPYKNVKPQIIAEEYMEDISGNGLTDYKFYCFNGVPKYLYVSNGMDNHETARLSFLTMNWEKAPFGRSDYLEFEVLPPKPTKFDEMVKIAKSLSGGHPFLRVDLYEINNKVYFSELTFSPCGGFMPFVPEEWDAKLGEMVNIRKVK